MLTVLFLILASAAAVVALMAIWILDLLNKKPSISPVNTTEWRYGDILKVDTDYEMNTAYFVVAVDGNKVIVRSANTYNYRTIPSSNDTVRKTILQVIEGKIPFDKEIESLFNSEESCHDEVIFTNLSLGRRKEVADIAAIKA